MASDIPSLTYTTASQVVFSKGRGQTIIGCVMPAAVDNSAVKLGFEASFDGGTTYNDMAVDVSGTGTPYRPVFVVSQYTVLDPDIMHGLSGAAKVRVTLYATDGSTKASQTSTVVKVVLGNTWK